MEGDRWHCNLSSGDRPAPAQKSGALYKLDCKQKANLLEGPLTEMYGSAVSGPAVAAVPCLEGNRKIQGSFFFINNISIDFNPASLPVEPHLHIQSMTLLFKFLLSRSEHICFKAMSKRSLLPTGFLPI